MQITIFGKIMAVLEERRTRRIMRRGARPQIKIPSVREPIGRRLQTPLRRVK